MGRYYLDKKGVDAVNENTRHRQSMGRASGRSWRRDRQGPVESTAPDPIETDYTNALAIEDIPAASVIERLVDPEGPLGGPTEKVLDPGVFLVRKFEQSFREDGDGKLVRHLVLSEVVSEAFNYFRVLVELEEDKQLIVKLLNNELINTDCDMVEYLEPEGSGP